MTHSDGHETKSHDWASGTVITGTGFFGRHRQHIRQLVHDAGGKYSGDLLMDYTTHLVYQDLALARQGEKYATALTWGIPVLPFSWLTDSAKQGYLLPPTKLPPLNQPEMPSSATKLQQLCLGEDALPCAAAAQTCVKQTDNIPAPLNVSSQSHSKHMLCNSLQQATPAEFGTADIVSSFGSYDPEQQACLAGERLDRQDANSSETCSNRSSPSCADRYTSSVPPDHAGQANAHSASDENELVIPDSQPDDACTLYECQRFAQPAMTAVPEGDEGSEDTQPDSADHASDPTAIIPDSPTEITTSSTEQQPLLHGAAQQSTGKHSCDASSDASPCTAPVPDTELQEASSASPLTAAALDDGTLAVSSTISSSAESKAPQELMAPQCGHVSVLNSTLTASSSSSSSAESQASQEVMIHQCTEDRPVHSPPQAQQHSSHQLLPQSVSSDSIGSPSTSYASRAFVIEDSDSESDFQPLKPGRPSTGSCQRSTQPASSSHKAVGNSHKPESSSHTAVSSSHKAAGNSAKAESWSRSDSVQQTACLSSCKSVREGCQGVMLVKLMARYPRGTTVKEHHGLSSLKGIQFAEQLQVNQFLLGTKDKKACALLNALASPDGQENCSSQSPSVPAEIQALYQLPTAQVQAAQADAYSPALPSGTDLKHELFRGVQRQHANVDTLQGMVTVRHSKATGQVKRSKSAADFFWRLCFDVESMQIVTDRPVTDFLQ